MKRTILTLATAVMLLAASSPALAQSAPTPPNPSCPTGGVPKKDGTGPGMKRGNRTGPQNGSGPIHTPPNQGRRTGRR